jgi:penicillin-insensitive murein endopeptidase
MGSLIDVRLRWILLALSLSLIATDVTHAKKSKWALAKQPASGVASAIGSYTAGCVRGAVKLPMNGTGYQVMRPARRRYYGHPALIDYLKTIAKKIDTEKLGPILVGDLGQPKGGPSPRGHASHQSGLDVDIWFWHPKKAERRKLTRRERRTLSAHRVVDPKKKVFTRYWSDDLTEILRIAASQPEVSRILVNPMIKKRLCDEGKLESSVLRLIRPWYGHADHMHVRLDCPEGSKHCKKQKPVPEGDGCDTLDWWFDDEAQAARKKGKKSYLDTVGAMPELPPQCAEL